MLKFKTSCAVLAYLSSNLLNEVGLSVFRYFEVGLRVCDIVVKKLTFAISSPDEFLYVSCDSLLYIFVVLLLRDATWAQFSDHALCVKIIQKESANSLSQLLQ